jgi:hypothetical protein
MGFTEEYLMAEQALSVYELGETVDTELVLPPVAQRILRAREALGLTQDEVAARWGEQSSMYPGTFGEWPIAGLRSVCLAAGVNWVEVVSMTQ